MRIFICGASGTGKSKLAEYLSQEYGLGFVSGSGRKLMKEFGYPNHQAMILDFVINPSKGLQFQEYLLDERVRMINTLTNPVTGEASWVSDRSPIDNYVYTMLQVGQHLPGNVVEAYKKKCEMQLRMATHLIYIWPTWESQEQLGDGLRNPNPFYQQMVADLMESEFSRFSNHMVFSEDEPHIVKTMELKHWNWGTRVRKIEDFLRISKFSKPE